MNFIITNQTNTWVIKTVSGYSICSAKFGECCGILVNDTVSISQGNRTLFSCPISQLGGLSGATASDQFDDLIDNFIG